MENRQPAIYIMTNKRNGTLYTGVTGDLVRRVYEHRNELCDGFTKKYGLKRLVYYELFDEMYFAIEREKQIKVGARKKKVMLIEGLNPQWRDLYFELG